MFQRYSALSVLAGSSRDARHAGQNTPRASLIQPRNRRGQRPSCPGTVSVSRSFQPPMKGGASITPTGSPVLWTNTSNTEGSAWLEKTTGCRIRVTSRTLKAYDEGPRYSHCRRRSTRFALGGIHADSGLHADGDEDSRNSRREFTRGTPEPREEMVGTLRSSVA
jgi:hypothetical protein